MDIILGFGITGAICSHYYPNAHVITRFDDNQNKNQFPLGPQYLYKSHETERLLFELDLSANTKTIKVGCFYEEKFQPMSVYTQQIYFRKTRGHGFIDHSSMSGRKPYFDILDINFNTIIDKITSSTNIEYDDIISIDLDNKELIGLNDIYRYDKLISTIPLPSFLDLCGIPHDLKYKSIIFSFVTDVSEQIWDNEYDYIYYPDEKLPFYRITKFNRPYCIYEYIKEITLHPLSSRYFNQMTLVLWNSMLQYGKIIPGYVPNLSQYDVELRGRYAEWRPSMKIHHLIRDLEHE